MRIRQFRVQTLELSLRALLLALVTCASAAFGASPSGVYALSNGKKITPQAVLENPNVDGLALRYSWDELEPREGVFDWSRLDAQIAAAHSHGKKISLGVTAGIHTPAWVYAGGAHYFTFVWDKSWGPPICSRQRIPIPWDPLFIAKWTAFVRQLGMRYSESRTVVYIKITGINAGTQETLLPHSREIPIVRAADACVSNDDVAEWQASGYSRRKIEQTWLDIAGSFAASFPQSSLGLMLVPGGFPPIQEEGQLMIGKKRDRKIALNLISEGLEKYGSRLVIQNNGLSAAHGWKEMAKLPTGTMNGWQMLWRATNDPSCRMNNRLHPCDPHSVLLAAVERGLRSNPAFIEIYQADILNPGLQDIVADAHNRLAKPGK
jgi:Beta-galactosidase